MTRKPDDIDRMLDIIEAEGSCIELRMRSGPGSEDAHSEMVETLIKEARLRLKGEKLESTLKALERLR